MRTVVQKRFERGDCRMLFIVGHMRSGSSLLVHILASNKAIVGFGEAHMNYGNGANLAEHAVRVYRRSGRVWPGGRYVLDKVLHERYGLSAPLLKAMDARTILLIRRPERALRSILELEVRIARSDTLACQYYVDRLKAVKNLARELGPERCTFLTYESLVGETSPTLQSLTSFLELEDPLTADYDLMWSTGKKGIGDPSERIKTGTVVKQDRSYKHEVSEESLNRAREAFEDCIASCEQSLGS
jgi:hypothetical protein